MSENNQTEAQTPPEELQSDVINETSEQTTSEETNLMAALDKALADVQEYKEKHLRTLADMENLRRRFAREKEDIRRMAASALLEDILPALDNLDIGLSSAARHPEAAEVAKGFEFVAVQLQQILKEHGLERLHPSRGDSFDHNIHEAVAQEASEDVPEDHVLKVVRTGYRLNDRLLRAASVVVSSGQA
jgi:molecular chaperone GrpE